MVYRKCPRCGWDKAMKTIGRTDKIVRITCASCGKVRIVER